MTAPRSAIPFAGQSVARVDGPLKVTGQARYAADHQIPDLVYATLAMATIARGVVDGIDTDAARAHPDVLEVLTDFNGVELPYEITRVSFFGQPVAMVVASTLEAATHGARLIDVRYRSEPQLTDIDAPGAVREPGQYPEYRRGDADAAIRAAAASVDGRYLIPRNYHNPMEMPATIARWEGERLTVWDKVQSVNGAQSAYGRALGIAPSSVHVVSPFVGGAFGSAGAVWPHQLLAAFAARQLQRPVKLVLSRTQMYGSVGYRPASRQRLAIGADDAGRFVGIIHEGTVEVSRYHEYEDNITRYPRAQYQATAARSIGRIVQMDVDAPTWMRGPGSVTGAFALECAIDELAHQIGVDPIELRARNEPDRDQSTGLPFSTRRLTECFERGAAEIGWSGRNPAPGSVRDGDQLIGLGTAAASYHTLRSESSAAARITTDGIAEVSSATSDMGPGTYTSITQVAADALGLPMQRVRFTLGDSTMPPAAIHAGSQTMASIGSAVLVTANMLRDRFIRTAVVDPASPLNGLRPADVTVVDGRMTSIADPSRGEAYQELLRRRGWDSLDAENAYIPDDADTRYSMHAYGAVFAEVAVDDLLRTIRIRRIYACYDAGRIINPKLAHSQAIGGMVGGIGMALMEAGDLDYRDGRVVNANMSDYLVPVNADVPALDASFLAAEDTIADPIGVKGLGEVVMVGVPAAIANAVFNATGRRVNELPIKIENLL